MACEIIPLNTKVIRRNANLLSATPNMGIAKLEKNIKSKASERTRTTEIGHVADGRDDSIFFGVQRPEMQPVKKVAVTSAFANSGNTKARGYVGEVPQPDVSRCSKSPSLDHLVGRY
jgi:hypothetical protein